MKIAIIGSRNLCIENLGEYLPAGITEIVSGLENPDFEGFFKAIARSWAATSTREAYKYYSQTDVHSPDKLRVNRTLSNIEEFYKTFGITEEDGMYVAPEDRVKIW